ncbi:MAG: tellurite resistance/C4-dicarboxylate transporter family protein [Solirubrobacterales bacterium]|nr:tellurite resistance/C4-dicarboxylate transporter family protein [Solirubrobacterales bacterium]
MPSGRAAAGAFHRVLDSVPPAAGAEVMGTGIVSIALSLDGLETISRILLVIAALMWVTLAILVPLRARRDRARFLGDRRTPPALTSVAGTAVLGTRLTLLGWTWAGIAALVIAVILWAVLLWPVLTHWKTPTVGTSLVLTVSTESLAVLAATLAASEHVDWLLVTALTPLGLGLCFYVFVISRFDMRQIGVGRGDHWITGGALAISTLAAGKITAAAKALATFGHGSGALKDLSVGLWVLTMLWLPVLVLAEALRPRLRYDVRRWSTVFPVGMYAACSFVVGSEARIGAITRFARVWVWIALALWAVVFVAMLVRATSVILGSAAPRAPTPTT